MIYGQRESLNGPCGISQGQFKGQRRGGEANSLSNIEHNGKEYAEKTLSSGRMTLIDRPLP